MPTNKIVTSAIAFLLLCNYVAGQHKLVCGTDQYMSKINHSHDYPKQPVFAYDQDSIIPIRYLPVVFHVLYNDSIDNISKAQIDDALSILNRDFRKQNPDTIDIIPEFKGLAADCRIEFKLATIDPLGNSSDGITRTYTDTLEFDNDEAQHSSKGGIDAWPNHKYLNIWVVKKIFGFAAGGTAAFPGTNPESDGILIMNNSVGTIGTGLSQWSRVFTHEAGHFLYLYHIWGGLTGCGDNVNCITDDIVDDTPNTKGNCTVCNDYEYSCGTLDNVQNYMDYAFKDKMFTYGQRDRMLATLNSTVGNRNNLWSEENLIETGVAANTAIYAINYEDLNLDIYPNPFNDKTVINFNNPLDDNFSIRLFDLSGKIIRQFDNIINNSITLEKGPLKSGFYFFQLSSKNQIITKKILIF